MFKKITALFLVLVLAFGCCSAFAKSYDDETVTEARSNTVKVTVNAYEIVAGNEGANADKNTPSSTVLTTVEINREDYEFVDWSIYKDGEFMKAYPDMHGFDITAGEITAGVTTSCTKTVKVMGTVKNSKGNPISFLEVELTYKIIWANGEIDDDKKKEIDPSDEDDSDDLQTKEGDFLVNISAPDSVWEGEPITYTCTPTIKDSFASMINNEGISYEVFVADGNDIIVDITTDAATGTIVEIAEKDHTYKIWAVGTLTYTVKDDVVELDS